MPYAFAVTVLHTKLLNGRRHVCFQIEESSVGPTDEWSIELSDPFWTLTLFEAQLVTAGSASTLDPELGLSSGFVIDTLDEVADTVTPSANVRVQDDVRFVGTHLYGRSKPDNTATLIRSRITLIAGHGAA